MRTSVLSAFLLPALGIGKLFRDDATLRDIGTTATIGGAIPASIPTASAPVATSTADLGSIELREAPDRGQIADAPVVNPAPADPADPAVAAPNIPAPAEPVAPVDPVLVVPAKPDPPPVPVPAPPANAAAPIDAGRTAIGLHPVAPTRTSISGAFVTVQWVETTLGGTYSTWMPHTISFWFQPENTRPALPGKGEIGMGTLTGRTGQTQTIALGGAAPTQGPGWIKGVAAAAVGVGIAGIFV